MTKADVNDQEALPDPHYMHCAVCQREWTSPEPYGGVCTNPECRQQVVEGRLQQMGKIQILGRCNSVEEEPITWIWAYGLIGKQLKVDTESHDMILDPALPIKDFYLIDTHEVGHGAYGVCVPGRHLESNSEVIIKAVSKATAGDDYLKMFKDRDLFHTLLKASWEKHPNVVEYLDFFIGPKRIFITMERLNGPELFDHLSNSISVSEHFLQRTMQQALCGIAFVHKMGIIHRDVKLENFRFRHAGNFSNGLALIDFGLCCAADPHERRNVVGTLLYMSPEVTTGHYSRPVDIWSAGVMLYVMLTGGFPFQRAIGDIVSEESLSEALERLACQGPLPIEAVNLVNRLLLLNPKERLTADDALAHNWFLTPASQNPLKISHSSARAMSGSSPVHGKGGYLQIGPMLSDLERTPAGGLERGRGTPCAASAGLLKRSDVPINIVFLDVDGVIAPCVNAGQIVWQCVQGVLTLCHVANARIVLTSSWRLLAGKVDLLNKVLSIHEGDAILDVTPDIVGQNVSEDLPEFASNRFVRVNEKKGFSLNDAVNALDILGVTDSEARDSLKAVFVDTDFDLHAFSEVACKYSRESFSPRSRRAADWVHEPCSASFAQSRCQAIQLWLQQASKQGFLVKEYVVLDDDDLIQRCMQSTRVHHRERTGSTEYSIVPQKAPTPLGVATAASQSVPTAPASAALVSSLVGIDEDDDPWAMAF